MQRRDWSYQKGYKSRWIIYCTTAIAPMIVEGAEVKPAGASAPQDHVAVIIPNDQWSPSQQGEEEEEEDDWSEFMPSCQVFSAKSKAYEELDKWQPWWETYEADEIVDLCPDPKTMRMFPSKPPTPKKKQPQGDPPAQPPAPPQEDKRPAEAAAPAEARAAAAQEEEAPAPAAAAAQEDDAPAPPQEEEAQRPRHKKEKEQPRKKKRHQKEQPQKATQAHKKKGMQPQLPLGQKTTDPNGRRSGRPKWWSKPLRISLNDSARYTWYSARHKAPSARCKYVARATLFSSVRTCTVAHFSDLSDSVSACVLGWMSNRECF